MGHYPQTLKESALPFPLAGKDDSAGEGTALSGRIRLSKHNKFILVITLPLGFNSGSAFDLPRDVGLNNLRLDIFYSKSGAERNMFFKLKFI